MQERVLAHVYSSEARLRRPVGYSSEPWILAIVLWGDALSVVHTFPPGGRKLVSGWAMSSELNQLQSSVELLKLSNFKEVTYSLYFKLRITASCDSLGLFRRGSCLSQLKPRHHNTCTDTQHQTKNLFPPQILPCSSSVAAAGAGRVVPNIAWLSS